MTELISLLKQLLDSGSIKIEITISTVQDGVQVQPKMFTARCKYCGWHQDYSSQRAATSAKNGHLAQCPKYGQVNELEHSEIPDWMRHSSSENED